MEVLVLVFLLSTSLVAGRPSQVERSLNGDGWTVIDTGGRLSKPVVARVPGQVHLDLMRAGIIDNPYADWNDWLYQWIGYSNWTYTGKLVINEDDMGKTIVLKCDGLDTIATVKVNGEIVGHANNYHRRHLFNVTDVIDAVGTHTVTVEFRSAANYSWERAAAYPYDLYTDIQGIFFNESQRGFVRKTQSDFGWDWGPGLVPCGIIRNISVVIFDQVYISDVIPKTFYDKGSYYLSVTVCVDVVGLHKSGQPEVTFTSNSTASGDKLTGKFTVTEDGETCHTSIGMEMPEATVESSAYWWPRGVRWPDIQGDPNLVGIGTAVEVVLFPGAINSLYVFKKVGYRQIELMQDPVGPNGTEGLTFYFAMKTASQVYPFYSKGSNFIPMDAFINRVTPEDAFRLLTSFVNGNQNMLRIWGGGLYQPDWFYDLCDTMGIMVWQELMFADALYPRNGAFLDNIEAEIRDVVRRLGHHPSIVLWSANNENQGILGNNTVWLVDYTTLYDEVVRTTLWEEDTTRLYWPSSPSNGVLVDDKETKMFIQRWGDVSDPKYGDLHRYDYNDYCLDVSNFPTPRFVSEFGFQSYPSSTSIKNVSQPVDWSNDSPFMNHRNHHPTGNKQMETLIAMVFNLPVNDNSEYKFLDFVYLSQVMQGLCITAQAEHYRRMLSTEGIFTRGTLYWQLNDIWEAQTWSSVEWTGQWKLLHYYMRRAYNHILISPYLSKDSVHAYLVLDLSNYQFHYTLQVSVISWATGKTVVNKMLPAAEHKGFTGLEVFNMKIADLFKGTSIKESFLLFNVSNTDEVLATNWLFPANFTEVSLPDAVLSTSDFVVTSGKDQHMITFTLTSTAVAPFVYLESTMYYGVFSDNGFLVLPGIPVKMSFSSFKKPDLATFRSGLTMRTIKDTYSNKPYHYGGYTTTGEKGARTGRFNKNEV